MASVADSFGDYGRNGSLAPSQRAARAVNHVIAWVIAVVLLLMAALAGYALWDANQVLKGTDYSQYEPGLGFADLRKLNPDVVAWITVDNTGIDHPVVQGEDNFEYLDKDAKGNDGASGSIFLDSECDPDFEETYEVLYGHHMQAGKMFGDLDKFLDEGFFNANQRAILYLPSETLSLQVCAVVKADAYDGVLFSTPADSTRVPQVIQKLEAEATYLREGSLVGSDRLIALSTCSSEGANERTVVICKVTGRQQADNA